MVEGATTLDFLMSWWDITESPTGEINIDEKVQAAHAVLAGPTAGASSKPGFRALVEADIPDGFATDAEVAADITAHAAAADPHSTYATDADLATHAAAADPHTGYQKESEKGVASGYPSLNASVKVVENPANATATPTASKIPIADGSGKLDGWITVPTAGPYAIYIPFGSSPTKGLTYLP